MNSDILEPRNMDVFYCIGHINSIAYTYYVTWIVIEETLYGFHDAYLCFALKQASNKKNLCVSKDSSCYFEY